MESKILTKTKLNKLENILYFLIVGAIIVDVLTEQTHKAVFILSTAILIMSVIGIICIGWVKLQLKQKGE